MTNIRCEQGEQKLIVVDLGLQVLDEVIMTRWKVLPRDQCQGKVGHRGLNSADS